MCGGAAGSGPGEHHPGLAALSAGWRQDDDTRATAHRSAARATLTDLAELVTLTYYMAQGTAYGAAMGARARSEAAYRELRVQLQPSGLWQLYGLPDAAWRTHLQVSAHVTTFTREFICFLSLLTSIGTY